MQLRLLRPASHADRVSLVRAPRAHARRRPVRSAPGPGPSALPSPCGDTVKSMSSRCCGQTADYPAGATAGSTCVQVSRVCRVGRFHYPGVCDVWMRLASHSSGSKRVAVDAREAGRCIHHRPASASLIATGTRPHAGPGPCRRRVLGGIVSRPVASSPRSCVHDAAARSHRGAGRPRPRVRVRPCPGPRRSRSPSGSRPGLHV